MAKNYIEMPRDSYFRIFRRALVHFILSSKLTLSINGVSLRGLTRLRI